MDLAKLIERAKSIVLSPKTEWEKIAAETTDVKSLYVGYAMILAAIPAICGMIGGTLVGVSVPIIGTMRTPIGAALVQLVLGYVLGLAVIYAVSLIVNALAPTFDGQKDPVQALKLVVYSSTPVWLAGVFSLIPMLGLLAIIAGLYGLYLLYIGLPVLMKNPPDKSIGYTALTIVCYFVLAIIVGVVVAAVVGTGAAMRGRF
jgi:Yip1 domain